MRVVAEKSPVISVIMGVYNQKHDTSMLWRSITSILNQSCYDIEYLICCDGDSSSEVYNLIERFCQTDKRVKLIIDKEANLLSKKLNVCLQNSKGSYIARMDDDDFSHPRRFEKQLEFLQEHLEYGYVGCSVQLLRDNELVGRRRLPEKPTSEDFLFVQPYIHPTLLFRKECFDQAGLYSEDIRCDHCEDFELLLRFEKKGIRGYNLADELLIYTLKPLSQDRVKYRWRYNYAVTRWKSFKSLGMLPRAIPYVIKPLIVGLLPSRLLDKLKRNRVYYS